MALKPWFKVIDPREDLKEGRPLDASEFAVHLDQVRDGRAPLVYQDPKEFFARTVLTKSLGGLAVEAVRRLGGKQVETSAVFNLSTQFGGGKTHSLVCLYHLANGGGDAASWKGVSGLLASAEVERLTKARVAVFVGTEFDSLTGRGGADGTPLRKTPWGEIAFQLGGAKLFDVVAEHDKTLTAPGGDVIEKMLAKDEPTLLLLDELMNYVSRARKSGLGSQLYNFLHNLSEVARGRKNVVLAVSIPASELEMTAEDEADFGRFKKLLDRLGKAVMLSADTETSEIIRTRLFDWHGMPADAKSTIREYTDWIVEHRNDVPSWFPVDRAYDAIAATYPFHPMVFSVFERKWQALPRFQQTRGVLRLLALWVSQSYVAGYKGLHKDPLITLGTAPLDDALFRAAAFEQLGEQRLEGAVTTDVTGKADAHAARLDREATEAVKKGRLHQKVATTIFFESNGGQLKEGLATEPEVRLSVGEPGVDLSSVTQCLDALSEACYYLHSEKGGFRFGLKPNLNKLLADRRANVPAPKIAERVRDVIKEAFDEGAGVERCYFPEKTSDIADRPVLTLAVMGPDRSLREPGTLTLIETMAREHGQASRVFKSGVIWSVADDTSALFDEARRLLAWQDIYDDRSDLKLEEPQEKLLKASIKQAEMHLQEAVWQSYRNLFLLDQDNAAPRRIDLGKIHSSAADSIVGLIVGQLREVDLLSDTISPNIVIRNWPPALTEWSTKSLRDAFYASPRFTRITSHDVVRNTIARGVTDGHLAYAGKRGDTYEPWIYKKALAAADVEISDGTFVLRGEDAEKVQAAINAGKPAKSSSIPPPPLPDEQGGKPKTPEPGPVSTRSVPGFTWEGDVPWQRWSQIYNRVVSRFSNKGGVKLHVKIEIAPPSGVGEQEVEETRSTLRELGLPDGVTIKKSDGS